MVQVARLNEDHVATIVAEAIRTGRPLDELVATALFGTDNRPHLWGDWSRRAVATWDMASRMWDDVENDRREGRESPGIEAVWCAISKLVSLSAWPYVPYLTWADIGTLLEVRPRSVTYLCSTVQGWRFDGLNDSRLALYAPCVRCETVHEAANIRDRMGPCCAGAA